MASTSTSTGPKRPVSIVCVGMAGSGKTTFMRRINSHLHSKDKPPYVINLDPAVLNVPFESNIDIRDSVNYEEVMKQYNLGPNGGIITSLNLFATKIDQVLGLLEKRAGLTSTEEEKPEEKEVVEEEKKEESSEEKPEEAKEEPAKQAAMEHILIDTPGQIEVFVWSASGSIILESLASSFPTVIAYVIDTPRTCSTSTFMSNMLYACSILYKTKLPMILVFNKTDVKDASFATEWMTDYEAFQKALNEDENRDILAGESYGGGATGYMGSLLNSMSLMLEEFYAHLSVVGVSSRLGTGIDEFFAAVDKKAAEFDATYQPELDRKRAKRADEQEAQRQKELEKMLKGMHMDTKGKTSVTVKDPVDQAAEEIEDHDLDSDEFADDDEEDREGLQARYEAAREAEKESIVAEGSFAKYLYTRH